jgi:hypothetical protein
LQLKKYAKIPDKRGKVTEVVGCYLAFERIVKEVGIEFHKSNFTTDT